MYNGIINVYKESGFTSFDVVAKLRGICKQKKIGHTGTLDPDAEGVLPVCLGKATKVCDLLTDRDKVYEVTMQLGLNTDTYDASGRILETYPTDGICEEMIEKALLSFVGSIRQVPPMYSALKVNGKKLYELAREGITVEREARPVTIYEISQVAFDLPKVSFTVHCSKGTYIRSLCYDVGAQLGCGAVMTYLKRTYAAGYDIEHSYTLSRIQELKDRDELDSIIQPIEDVFGSYEKMIVKASADRLLQNGNKLNPADFDIPSQTDDRNDLTDTLIVQDLDRKLRTQPVRVCFSDHTFAAIYQFDASEEIWRPVKMFL